MTLAKGLFIDAKVGDGLRLLAGLATLNSTLHHTPCLLPIQIQKVARTRYGAALLQHVDDPMLEQHGEPASPLGPWH